MSKFQIPRPIITRRSGVTLIETLVALGLLVSLLLMWRPVVVSMGNWQWRDGEALDVMAFKQAVENQLPTTNRIEVKDDRLVLHYETIDKIVRLYNGDNGSQLVLSLSDGQGYEPLLVNVKAMSWQWLNHAAKYTLTMKSGRVYEGVITDAEIAR